MAGRIYRGFAAAFALVACGAAHGAYVANGDFESITGTPEPAVTFTGWAESTFNGATPASPATVAPVGITGRSAKLTQTSGSYFRQAPADPLLQLKSFVFELDFATSDPGTGTNRSFNLNLRYHPTDPVSNYNGVNLRVIDNVGTANIGDVQIFNGAWQTIASLTDSVSFSANDASLNVNHLKVVADLGAAKYSVYIKDAGGTERSVLDLSYWHIAAPTATSSLTNFGIDTGNPVAGSWSVVDNVTLVPEPTAMALLGLTSLALMRRRA